MNPDTPVTRARLAESKVKWESLEFTVTEGLGDLQCIQNEVTRETRECTTIMNKILLHQEKKQKPEGDPHGRRVTGTEDLKHQEGCLLLQGGDLRHQLQEELGARV